MRYRQNYLDVDFDRVLSKAERRLKRLIDSINQNGRYITFSIDMPQGDIISFDVYDHDSGIPYEVDIDTIVGYDSRRDVDTYEIEVMDTNGYAHTVVNGQSSLNERDYDIAISVALGQIENQLDA